MVRALERVPEPARTRSRERVRLADLPDAADQVDPAVPEDVAVLVDLEDLADLVVAVVLPVEVAGQADAAVSCWVGRELAATSIGRM